MSSSSRKIKISRAPVLTLWAAVVAERLGVVSLGLFHPVPESPLEHGKKLQKGKTLTIALLGRAVPVVHTPDGLRALTKDKPDDPANVARYLEGKFGEALPEVRAAMARLKELERG